MTTDPTITHHSWCDRERCAEDHAGRDHRLVNVYHWGTERTWAPTTIDPELGRVPSVRAEVSMSAVDDIDTPAESTPPEVFVSLSGSDVSMMVDDLAALGFWLATQAVELRLAIGATEAGR